MNVKQLDKLILSQITKQSDRDKQKNIGPSEIGGCPICVGEKLALKLPDLYPDLYEEDSFGLASWIGTGVHGHLEETVDIPGAIKEQKNFIYHLEGYGDIKGSTDFFLEPHLKDWKVIGKYSLDKMKMAWKTEPNKIPTQTYRVQQMLYGKGWADLGYKVETVGLVVIPKLSNDPDDIRFYTERYNPEIATRALDRLEKIWKYVQDGRLEELPSDADCYRCTRVLFRA